MVNTRREFPCCSDDAFERKVFANSSQAEAGSIMDQEDHDICDDMNADDMK